jgi:DNA-binding response OmpR family regulator
VLSHPGASNPDGADAIFTIGPYTFQPVAKMLLDPIGKKIRLTGKEAAVLKYLYRASPRVIGRDTLLGEVWGYNAGVAIRWRPISIACARRSSVIQPGPKSW